MRYVTAPPESSVDAFHDSATASGAVCTCAASPAGGAGGVKSALGREADRPPEGRERALRRQVRPRRARLPAREDRLVREQEVEVRADVRLAGREADRVEHLGRLVGRGAGRRGRGRVGLPAGVVGQRGHVLGARVEARLAGRHRGLEAVLEVPEPGTGAGERLAGAVECAPEVVHQLVPVARADRRRPDGCAQGRSATFAGYGWKPTVSRIRALRPLAR